MAADESKHDTADAAVAAAAVPSPAGAGKTEAVPSKSAIAAVAEAANPDLNPDGDTPDAGCFVIVTSAPTQAGPAACSDVEDVIIAPAGTKGFKYILFTVTDTATGTSKVVVRGHPDSWHKLVFRRYHVTGDGRTSALPSGGGRIVHTDNAILVFGSSGDFGVGDHKYAAGQIFKKYGKSKTVAYATGADLGY